MDEVGVRVARAGDLAALPPIESSADALFLEVGIRFPEGPTVIEQMVERGERVLVAGDPPVGYAATSSADGGVYLEQIAVRAELTGRGIGGLLLAAVVAEAEAGGASGVSLLTFRDVRWNAPWYRSWGFAEVDPDACGPSVRRHWDAEVAAGLHRLGVRVAMRRPLNGQGVRAGSGGAGRRMDASSEQA